MTIDSSAWTGRGPRWTGRRLFDECREVMRFMVTVDWASMTTRPALADKEGGKRDRI